MRPMSTGNVSGNERGTIDFNFSELFGPPVQPLDRPYWELRGDQHPVLAFIRTSMNFIYPSKAIAPGFQMDPQETNRFFWIAFWCFTIVLYTLGFLELGCGLLNSALKGLLTAGGTLIANLIVASAKLLTILITPLLFILIVYVNAYVSELAINRKGYQTSLPEMINFWKHIVGISLGFNLILEIVLIPLLFLAVCLSLTIILIPITMFFIVIVAIGVVVVNLAFYLLYFRELMIKAMNIEERTATTISGITLAVDIVVSLLFVVIKLLVGIIAALLGTALPGL